MGSMHSLLRRQLKRFFADPSNLPEELTGFIQAVNDAYMQSDNDRGMLERSLDLSSQELMHANSELRAIFEAIPDLFFRIDANGKILSIKSGSTVDLYLPPARFIGKYLQDFPEPAIAQLLSNAIKEVGTRKTLVNVEYELQRDEHSEFFEARLLPLLENQIVVIIRNITERKQAEESIEGRFPSIALRWNRASMVFWLSTMPEKWSASIVDLLKCGVFRRQLSHRKTIIKLYPSCRIN